MPQRAYIRFSAPGNCQPADSARWGAQRRFENKTTDKTLKTALGIAPGLFAVRLAQRGRQLGWLAVLFCAARTGQFCSVDLVLKEMTGGIQLAEALERMETAQEPFTLRFVKVDRRRKTGGQIVEWQNCRLSGPRRQRARELAVQAATTGARHHRHYANGTRNLVVGQGGQRRKVHIWLLLAFNGQHVVLG